MLKILGNIAEMFVYASVYLFISMIALRIVATGLSSDYGKLTAEGSVGFSVIMAALCIGMAVIFSTVIR
jgi:hypothetical protein